MLVPAEAIGEEIAHTVSNDLNIAIFNKFENGVYPLAEFRIRQTNDDARTHLWMRAYCGFNLGRIDVGATAQNHVGQSISKIQVAVRIKPSDIAQRFPAV